MYDSFRDPEKLSRSVAEPKMATYIRHTRYENLLRRLAKRMAELDSEANKMAQLAAQNAKEMKQKASGEESKEGENDDDDVDNDDDKEGGGDNDNVAGRGNRTRRNGKKGLSRPVVTSPPSARRGSRLTSLPEEPEDESDGRPPSPILVKKEN